MKILDDLAEKLNDKLSDRQKGLIIIGCVVCVPVILVVTAYLTARLMGY